MVQLQGIIEQNETTGDTVPPGIYAEYGYSLFQIGEYPDAIQYFEKEKSAWAESVPLMLAISAAGCATVPPKDYTKFRQSDPHSILIVPAIITKS